MAKSDIVLDDEEISLQGRVRVKPDESGSQGVRIFPGRGNLRVGGDGAEGDLVVESSEGENRIHLDSGSDNVSSSPAAMYANKSGFLHLGIEEKGGNGELQLSDDEGTSRVKITGGDTSTPSGETEPADDGDSSDWRDSTRRREQGPRVDTPTLPPEERPDFSGPTRVHLDGHTATLHLGGAGKGGEIVLQDPDADSGSGQTLRLNTNPEDETRISLQQPDGSTAMTLSADGTIEVDTKVVIDGEELTGEDIRELKELL